MSYRQKFHFRMRILLFFLFFLSVGAGALFLKLYPQNNPWKQHKSEQIIQEKREVEFLLEGTKRLTQLWREGDVQGAWKTGQLKCPKSLGEPFVVGDDYLKCNPRYILCAMENKSFKIELDGEEREVVLAQNDYRLVTMANTTLRSWSRPLYKFELKLTRGKKTLPVLLEQDCHEVFLPERIYKYKNFLWDNYKANIFVDKFLVSFADVADWLKFGGEEKIELPKTEEGLSHFAHGLTIDQMKAYCAFKGKQLMTSVVFDAASMYPADLSNPEEEDVLNTPYPWTRKKAITQDEALCTKIYSEECLSRKAFSTFGTEAATWSGMFLSLGGPLEAMENPVDSYLNLKASSFYFPFSSPWHQLGLRAHWEGNGFRDRDFDWGENSKNKNRKPQKNIEEYQVGFRCLRTVYKDERP